MKDYNEMAKAVFERRDEYVANRKKQRALIFKAGIPLCALVLVCLVGFSLRLDRIQDDVLVAPVVPAVEADNTFGQNSEKEDTGMVQNKPVVESAPEEQMDSAQEPLKKDPVEQIKPKPTVVPDGNDKEDLEDKPVIPDAEVPKDPVEIPTEEPEPGGSEDFFDPNDPPVPTEPMAPVPPVPPDEWVSPTEPPTSEPLDSEEKVPFE